MLIPQVFHCPAVNQLGQIDATRMQVLKLDQSKDALRDAMAVDRVSAIVEITNRSVFTEEMLSVELESTADMRLKF